MRVNSTRERETEDKQIKKKKKDKATPHLMIVMKREKKTENKKQVRLIE